MLIERMFFNVFAFWLFIFIFYKMVKKNDSNIIAILVIQALGIALSFFELMYGKIEWTTLKTFSYILAIFIPIIYLLFDNKNINLIEKFQIIIAKIDLILNKNILAQKKLIYIVDKYPQSYEAHRMLAQIYEKDGGMRKAIDEYIIAIDINKSDYDSYFKIANLLNSLTRKDEAITMLNNLLKIKPDYIQASILLCDLLIEKDKFKEVTNICTEALKWNPDNYDLYYNLGMAYTMINDFKNAKQAYEKAAELNHMQYMALYNLGKIALMYNDISGAEKYFTKAIYGPDVEAMAYYELAKIHMLKREKEKAIVFLENAIEIDKIYVEKMNEDVIFIPIKAYIRTNITKNTEKRNALSSKEVMVQNHLDKTYGIVEKLNVVNNRIPVNINKNRDTMEK